MNNIKKILPALLICTPFLCKAQQFTGKYNIPPVSESGYYHLLLTPEAVAASSPNLEDIRIKNDQSGKEIPYLLRSEKSKTTTSAFFQYNILENQFNKKDSTTRIVIGNDKKEEINQFHIVVQRAEIAKSVSVKGSDDKETWYVVKQKTPIISVIGYNIENEILTVNIPAGRYRYYEILIDNPQKDPIRVTTVGRYEQNEIAGQYSEVALGSFIQKDSADKRSYIRFPNVKQNYLVDKISFEIEGALPYYRRASFSGNNSSFHLASNSKNTIDVVGTYIDSTTTIFINNFDDSPLKIKKITAYQLARYLTVYLEKDEKYTLYFGDKTLQKPQYDMVHFEKNIPNGLTVLTTDTLKEISTQQTVIELPKQRFWETQIFLWAVILGVGLLLGWICYTMIGEIKKK